MEKFVNIVISTAIGATTIAGIGAFIVSLIHLISTLGLKIFILIALIVICYLVGSVIFKKLQS